jgi:hypothetical protein
MDSKREAEVLRAVVKKMMSVEGLRFDRNHTLRDIGRRVVEFNEQTNIGDPITVTEFCKLYLDIMQELVAEHFALIEKKIAEARLDNEHFRDDPR